MIGTPLTETLLKLALASPRQLRAAEDAAAQRAIPMAQALIELSVCSERALAEALCEMTALPQAESGPLIARPEALSRLPLELAKRHGLFPLALLDGGRKLSVAMIDPTQPEAFEAVRRAAFAEPRPVVALVSQWKRGLEQYQPTIPLEKSGKTAETGLPKAPSGPAEKKTLQERLHALTEGQKQVGRVLRAVTELLAEKGFKPLRGPGQS